MLGPGPANGGLGNQLFCIATALGLAWKNNDKAVFPDLNGEVFKVYKDTIFHKLDCFPLKESFIDYAYREPPYTSTIHDEIPYQKNTCLVGHFQSYKYFHDYEKELQAILTLPESLKNDIADRYSAILSLENTVSLHIRRGDYVDKSHLYTTLSGKYYKQALELIEKYDNVIIFSDDIDWCKKNTDYISVNKYFIKDLDYIDIYLMSKMDHNIIANSTFSWWGAYLNSNPSKKVIAPLEWFGPARAKDNKKETRDLIPKTWIRI